MNIKLFTLILISFLCLDIDIWAQDFPIEIDFPEIWYSVDSIETDSNLISKFHNKNNDFYSSFIIESKPAIIETEYLSYAAFGNYFDDLSPTFFDFENIDLVNGDYTVMIFAKRQEYETIINYFLSGTSQGFLLGGTHGLYSNPGIYNDGSGLRSSVESDTTWQIFTFFSDSIFYDLNSVNTNGSEINSISLSRFGTTVTNENLFFHGDFLELLIFDYRLNNFEFNKVQLYLKEKHFPSIKLDPDQSCVPSNYQLQSNIQHKSILWSTGDTTDYIDIDSAGTYWVTAEDHFNFISSDTIVIGGIFNGAPDTLFSQGLCAGDSTLYNPGLPQDGYNFLWSNGDTLNTIYAKEEGEYYVDIWDANGCMLTSDTVEISISNYSSTTSLPLNPTLCVNGILALESGAAETISYEWYSDGSPALPISTEAFIIPDAEQSYWVQATNEIGCVAIDTTFVNLLLTVPTPIAAFENELLCNGKAIQFLDTSIQEESTLEEWEWSTSDEQFSTLQDPQFTFIDYGAHSVSLKVTNEEGCTSFISKEVYVQASPEINVVIEDNLCSNTAIHVQDSSSIEEGGLNSWTWLLDGETLPEQSPPNRTLFEVESGGDYILTQVVESDSGCVSELLTELEFRTSPVSSFVSDTVCIGTPVTLNATSDTSGVGEVFYEWIDQSGEYIGGAQQINIATGNDEYPSGGQYSILLITHTNDAYCSDTLSYLFRVEDLPEVEIFRDQACINDNVTLNAEIQGLQYLTSWEWTVEGQANGQEESFSFTPSESGYVNYSLLSSTQLLGCETLVEDSVYIYPQPLAFFENSEVNCINEELSFQAETQVEDSIHGLSFEWSSNNEILSIDTSLYININTPGPYPLLLRVQNAGNCEDEYEESIVINGANVNILYTQSCEGDETELIALPDTSYSGPTSSQWLFDNGDSQQGHMIYYDLGDAGFHWVINSITDTEHACVDIDSVEVKVSSWPIAAFNSPSICAEDEFTLFSVSDEGNDPISAQLWVLEDGQEFEGSSLSYSYDIPGSYPVTLIISTEEAGCIDSLEQYIEVDSLPIGAFTYSPEGGQVPLDVEFSNQSEGASIYTWFLGDTDVSFDPEPIYTFSDSGWVYVRLVSETLQGCAGEKMDSIYVDPPRIDIEVLEVVPEWDGQFVSIRARVQNNGYYLVEEFESLTSLATNAPLKKIEQLAIPGSEYRLTDLSSSWYVDERGQAFACVEVSLADGTKDEVPENDKKCVALSTESFIVYNPFPNPGNEFLTLRMLLPEKGEYNVEIYSSNGQMMLGEKYNGSEGFNELTLSTVSLGSGNYKLRVEYDGKTEVFSWVKH